MNLPRSNAGDAAAGTVLGLLELALKVFLVALVGLGEADLGAAIGVLGLHAAEKGLLRQVFRGIVDLAAKEPIDRIEVASEELLARTLVAFAPSFEACARMSGKSPSQSSPCPRHASRNASSTPPSIPFSPQM